MNYDLDAIRARFPSLSLTDGGKSRVYFDNPAGTQVPTTVMNAMTDCLLNANANLGGGFETSRRADAVLADAHAAMADFLNAQSVQEIIFGQNMTTLTLHISRSIGRTMRPGDEIIVSRMDHDANIAPWLLLAEDLDLRIRWLEFDTETCEFDTAALGELLTGRTRLLCVGGASNLTGTINDIATMTRIAHEAGAMIYVDAVQLAPHVPIDVQAIGCDFLACSAYKFFGPHQGILYGREDRLEQLTPYKVRPAPERPPGAFETGTQSHEGMAGTTAAVDYFAAVGGDLAVDYRDRNADYAGRRGRIRAALQYFYDYETTLVRHLIDGLQAMSRVRIHGITDPAAFDRRVPTVAFTVDGVRPAELASALAEKNIFVWSGHNYAVEVARSLGILEAGGAVRIGPVHYNSVQEIDRLLNALDDLLPRS